MEVVGGTSITYEAAAQVADTKPDVVVTQLGMQTKGAQEIIEGLHAASPGSRIVVLAARGLSNRLISKELHLSKATIKRPLANVYQKVGVHSWNDAVRKAITEQWIGIHEITSASSADGDGSDGQAG